MLRSVTRIFIARTDEASETQRLNTILAVLSFRGGGARRGIRLQAQVVSENEGNLWR